MDHPDESTAAMTLEQIYDQEADFVWRMLHRLGVPERDLPDTLQEVFLSVHRNLAHFEWRCSLTTWLFTICRSIARDHRRRVHHRHEVQDDGEIETQVDLRSDVHGAAESNERLSVLESILGTLAPEQRNVFVLFEIERMTGQEASEALSIPLGTVYSRLALARKAFRQALSRREMSEDSPALRAAGKP